MKISPRELREAKIPSKAFGFNQDVVDALLERAADTIEGLIEENRQLFEALEQLRNEGTSTPIGGMFDGVNMQAVAEPAGSPEPEVVAPAVEEVPPVAVPVSATDMSEKEDLINKTLLLAQRTADETLTTAKAQAEELVSAAQAQADELVSNATRDAENLTGTAQEQAQKDLLAAQEQAQKLVSAAEAQAEELVSAAQAQADSIHAKERENFTALIEQLNAERVQLISDIQILQGFDQEHRTKLREVVEQDLDKLSERETIDVGALPEMPVISLADIPSVVAKPAEDISLDENLEVIADDDAIVEPASFDEMLETTIAEVEPASEEEGESDIVISDDMEVEAIDIDEKKVSSPFDDDDPFASFVDSDSVVPPAGSDMPIGDPQVVAPAGEEVESSGSSGNFDPGASSKSSRHKELDDDDFFASLREAVQDDTPLGPSDEGEERSTKPKGKSKK